MDITNYRSQDVRLAGYVALSDKLDIPSIPTWHESLVASGNTHRVETVEGVIREIYPARYWPGDGIGDHLEFALKYDGVNLTILARIFDAVATDEIVAFIASKPTGKYARRIWYLYEFITGSRLPLDDLKQGNYVDVLESDVYVTINPARQVKRHRINDNMLGDSRFCPIIRRTETIQRCMNTDLRARCQQVVADYPPELLRRALSYLYTKETKSSFEIEHEKPSANRMERFIALLELAQKKDFCDKDSLIDLQNRIVDPRFADADYRKSQNYVGETVAWQAERVHYVCPKPGDLPNLMTGLIEAHGRMRGGWGQGWGLSWGSDGGVHPVLHAAVVAYGFVFLHPFEDGNGRIHRFLIHNILARSGFTPEGLMFPVSAAMLKNPGQYDSSLEAFSKQVMSRIEYALDEEGKMTVLNDTADWYRFIDMTPQAEALFGFIEKTIETELVEELNFLNNYDRTKSAIQEIVDMPDRQIDLFIRVCLQNQGRLSSRKRADYFTTLTDDEIARMEQAVWAAYGESVSRQ